MHYQPDAARYQQMEYRRSGRSGLKLPAVSLGLWHNFGDSTRVDNSRALLRHAFDCGITHFDLANNYGPPPGSAEENFGRILREDFHGYRDELIISTKAGYTMWDGPYGDWGSRKYLVSSLDQSLKRMGLEYVDIFYHHRPDPETPLEETMMALDQVVRQGKALYAAISNYPAGRAAEAIQILRDPGTPCLIHQPKYSLFERQPEGGLLDVLQREGVGCIAFSPLAGGVLTDRYLNGVPEDSRAASGSRFLSTGADAATEPPQRGRTAGNRRAAALIPLSGCVRTARKFSIQINLIFFRTQLLLFARDIYMLAQQCCCLRTDKEKYETRPYYCRFAGKFVTFRDTHSTCRRRFHHPGPGHYSATGRPRSSWSLLGRRTLARRTLVA